MVYIVIHGTHSYLIAHPAMSHLCFWYHCPASSCHPATAYHGAKGLFSCRLVLKQTLVFVNVQLLSNSWSLKDELTPIAQASKVQLEENQSLIV